MRVQALGHAGLRLDHCDTRVVIDPWFNPEGAFQASWFPFPRNDHILSGELFQATAIVISHEHMDHVDPWFLARVSPSVPVIIPTYPAPALKEKILVAGQRPIVEVEPWQRHRIADDVTIFFVSETSPMNHDSAMILEAGGRSLVNLNDARISPPQLRKIRSMVGGNVDVLALQGAGASWFPICYDYPAPRMAELSLSKRRAKLGYVERVVGIVEPAVTLPTAGPPCFLDDELRLYNEELGAAGIFPTQDQVAAHLGAAGLEDVATLLPGDVWDTDAGSHIGDDHWRGFSFAESEQYIDDYARVRLGDIAAVRQRHPMPQHDLWPSFLAYFDPLLEMNEYFNDQIGMRVGFDITGPGGGAWAVDFRPGQEGVFADLGDCQYRYTFEGRWLPPIVEGRVPWEDFFLSLRFRSRRNPDLYNDHLLGLLKFAVPEALDAVQEYETAEHVEAVTLVEADGVAYEIQRYCPHAGLDLAESAEVLPGPILRCLGHHYEFDLTTGECVNGQTGPLQTAVVIGASSS